MPLTLRDNLPFTTITVTYQGRTMDIPQVLVDTGSATTLLAADIVATIGMVLYHRMSCIRCSVWVALKLSSRVALTLCR